MLLALMKDDRVQVNLDLLQKLLEEELERVSQFRRHIWVRFHELVSDVIDTPESLRQLVLRSILCFASSVNQRILKRLRNYPFSLLQGNIADNINRMCDGNCPVERIAFCIWNLRNRAHWSMARIIQALSLLKDLGLTSMVIEQAHAAIALMRRFHKEYSELTLIVRAMLYILNRFIDHEPIRKRIEILDQRRETLDNRCAGRVSGYGMVVKDAYRSAEHAQGRGRVGFEQGQTVVQLAAEVWNGMNMQERHAMYLRSRQHAREQSALNFASADALQLQIVELKNKEEDRLVARGSFRSTAGCTLSPSALERLVSWWKSSEFAMPRVHAYLDRNATRPLPMQPALEDELLLFPHPEFDNEELQMDNDVWAMARCWAKVRGHCYGVGITIGHYEVSRSFLFCSASLNPFAAFFLRL